METKTPDELKGMTGHIPEGWNFPAGNITVIGVGQMPYSLEIAYANGQTMEFDRDFIVKHLDS